MQIYFSGIGGAGLAALAQLAQDCGYQVSGSDAAASRNTDLLKKRGIKIYLGQSGKEIADAHGQSAIDWFVGTSALSADHPELKFAKTNGIRISKRDELINHIIKVKNLKLIAISGTHGKTTTTAMLVWLFKQFKQPVSYAVGTNLSFGPSGQYQLNSQYFIYEADEFDRNFLNFRPEVCVIPAVEYDHSDTYPTNEAYHLAFRDFINQSHSGYIWKKAASSIGLADNTKLHLLDENSEDIKQITLIGNQNRHNGYLALQVAKNILKNSDYHLLLTSLNNFPGSERRMEKLAENLYSDYAHHPTEIAATLQLAAELGKNIVVVYQPHQNIRQHEIKDKYKGCFAGAKKIYWLPTYLSREDPDLPILKPEELLSRTVLDSQKITEVAEMNDSLTKKIKEHLSQGDLVIVMGAGSIDSWARQNLI